MNSNLDDIDHLEKLEATGLFYRLPEHGEKLEEQIGCFWSKLESDMNDLQPKVSGSEASKEELVELARKFRDAHDEHMDRVDVDAEAIMSKIQLLRSLYDRIGKRFDVIDVLEDQVEKSDLDFARSIMRDEIHKCNGLRSEFTYKEKLRRDGKWLQSGLQKLVESQKDDETKRWFLKEGMVQFSDHFRFSNSVRPGVVVGSGKHDLPSEIKEMILAFADLETCVELREVSKEWYVVFNSSEQTMKSNLKKRNPWISPGDPDLQTWADCVLVFVRRLKNPKWMAVLSGDVDKIEIPAQPLRRKTVVEVELKLDETLPAEFEGLFDEPDHVTIVNGPDSVEYSIDPWTLRSRKALMPYTEVLEDDEDGTVINYEGIDITLDPSYGFEDVFDLLYNVRFSWPVELGSHSIRVFFHDRTVFVAPRDKPHFEHGMVLDAAGHGALESITEVGDVLVHQLQLRHNYYSYNLVDLDSKTTTPISRGTIKLVASFNGLVWCEFPTSLVPTFVDLQNPGTTYYRADRVISGDKSTYKFKQCSKSKGLGQFVYLDNRRDAAVIDLATGIKTTIVPPPGLSDPGAFIIGSLNDMFQARCLKSKVLKTIHDTLQAEHGFLPQIQLQGGILNFAAMNF